LLFDLLHVHRSTRFLFSLFGGVLLPDSIT
jgi:hypothetical protein